MKELTLDELYALREVYERALRDEELSLELSDAERIRLKWPTIKTVLKQHAVASYNSVYFSDEASVRSMLSKVEDIISEKEAQKSILDMQVRAARWSWLSYVIAAVSALAAAFSAACALFTACHQ